jgi:hypothetical protein
MHELSGIVQHAVGSMLGNNGTRTEGLRKERVGAYAAVAERLEPDGERR